MNRNAAKANAGAPQNAKQSSAALPFVTLKAALTLDGRMATATGDSKWITSEVARAHAHRMRAQSDVVMVGVGTVLADDPELTVRHVRGKNPIRVVVDARLRTPLKCKLVQTANQTPTWIFHGPHVGARAKSALLAAGVQLVAVRTLASGRIDLKAVLKALAKRDVARVLVEGGPHLNGGLLDQRLVDRVSLFLAPKLLADPRALPLAFGKSRVRMAQALQLNSLRVKAFGPDVLLTADVVRT